MIVAKASAPRIINNMEPSTTGPHQPQLHQAHRNGEALHDSAVQHNIPPARVYQ